MTSPSTHADRVAAFRTLHAAQGSPRPLLLLNPWDAASARLMERVGAPALGTTSAAVSWARGRADGQGLGRDEMVAEVRRIVEAVSVPVTADVEAGYGDRSVRAVATTVRAVVAAGAVGINLEDAADTPGALLEPERQAERIAAARGVAAELGVDLFVNARTDVFLAAVGAPAERLEHSLARAARYLEAGADGVFVPGVVDAATIRQLARGIDGPLNVMAGPGAPTVAELGALGVARVSVGPGLGLVGLGAVEAAARGLLDRGDFAALAGAMPYASAAELFAPEPAGG